MADRLRGKVAIVSGGASGIGAATARLFAQEGARVMIIDRSEPSDERLVDALKTHADAMAFTAVDVTDEERVRAAIAATVARWGRLDVAVGCAGILVTGGVADLSEAQWDQSMAVNVKGVFFLSKHAIPEMRKAGGGSIINISSSFGIVGGAGYAAYSASKGAVRLLTKATALEHAAEGIRVNSVHPGVVETPMLTRTMAAIDNPDAVIAAITAQLPIGAAGSPEDIAWGCVYLASDEARHVTGSELVIDGGMTAH